MPQEDISRAIGIKVRAGRKSIGLTRKQLASAADVSERYLHELENGIANASVGILVKVADALGQDFTQLVTSARPSRRDPTTGTTPSPISQPWHSRLEDLFRDMSPAEREGALPVLERYLAERRRASKGIALIGLRGAGKSTLGRRLADRHGLPFVSITQQIEERAGMSLADLFNLGGPDAYRTLENDVISDLTRRDDQIVAETAGGIVGNSQALDMILGAFKTIWLKASPEEHLARVAGQGDTRPMRDNPKALEHLKALLAAREPEYARAECIIDTSGRSIDACLAELAGIVEPLLQPHALEQRGMAP